MAEPKNSQVIIGTLRTSSMYPVASRRKMGIEEVRARARTRPTGKESAMPLTARRMVRLKPPRKVVPWNSRDVLAAPRRNATTISTAATIQARTRLVLPPSVPPKVGVTSRNKAKATISVR